MRLIDADALCESPLYFVGDEVFVNIKAVENASTIDAVPVVRCEKCAHHSDILLKGMEDFVWCNFFNLYRCKDSFCSCGWVE